jgi:hypothetical protein
LFEECADDLWVELAASPAASHRHRTVDAIGALADLGHVGELGDPHRQRNVFAASAIGQSSPVLASEGECQGGLHIRTQADALRQQRRRCTVRSETRRARLPRALANNAAMTVSLRINGSPPATLPSKNRT